MDRVSPNLLWMLVVLCLCLAVFTRCAQAGKVMRARPASGTVVSYACIDTRQGIHACMPRSALFGDAGRRALYPPITDTDGAVSSHPLALTPLKSDACNAASPRHDTPVLAQVLFGRRIPDMRLGFENFELDMDVRADLHGLGFSGIHLGYRNCW